MLPLIITKQAEIRRPSINVVFILLVFFLFLFCLFYWGFFCLFGFFFVCLFGFFLFFFFIFTSFYETTKQSFPHFYKKQNTQIPTYIAFTTLIKLQVFIDW